MLNPLPPPKKGKKILEYKGEGYLDVHSGPFGFFSVILLLA